MEINPELIEKVDIPSWTDYFISIAKVVSLRSKDAQTKVGCVITDDRNYIISTGYNSFPSGLWDYALPNKRPAKYSVMLHAEASAIASMRISPHSVQNGCTMYLTMRPCLDCFKLILNSNIRKLYALDTPVSKETMKNEEIFNLLLHQSSIEYNLVKPNLSYLTNLINGENTEGDRIQDTT